MIKKLAAFIKEQFIPRPRYIVFTLLAFILVNAFWWLAGQWFFTFRPYLNYDYLPAMMAAPVSGVLSFFLLLFVFAEELFISNALIYHFKDISSFITSGEYAGNLDLTAFFSAAEIIFFAGFLVLAFVLSRRLPSRTNAVAIVIVLVLAFGADQLNGSSYLLKSDHQMVKGNIGGSSSLKIYTSFKENVKNPQPLMPIAPQEQRLPLAQLLTWSHKNPERSVLFIVVESYGMNKSDAADRWLRDQLLTPAVRREYYNKFGHTRFAGATTSAELRHLCSVKGSYNTEFTANDLMYCVPKAFSDLGYPAVAAHGFTGNMFRRNVWWPQVGFNQELFADEFKAMGAPGCGSGLYGICDDFIIHYLGQRIQEEPGFYYHLTLNTHLPVVDVEPAPALSQICSDENMPREVCALNAKVGAYLSAVAAVIADLPEKPFVFVVGDHAPPFSAQNSRKLYSREETPFFVLQPRSAINDPVEEAMVTGMVKEEETIEPAVYE